MKTLPITICRCGFVLALSASLAFADQQQMIEYTREAISLPSNEQGRKIELYTKAIEAYPSFYLPYTNRAVCYLNYGKWSLAIADANKAVELAPENPHPWGVRGRAYAGNRQFDQAYKDLSRALQLSRNDEQTRNLHNDRGNVYFSDRKYDEAIRDYARAVEIDPHFASGFNNLGIAYRAKGDWDNASHSLSAAIKLDPLSARAYANRGRVFVARHDPMLAMQDFDRAVQLDSKDATALLNRGMLHYLNKDMTKAASDFSRAFVVDPTNPYAAIWRYITGANTGFRDDARVQLERFLVDSKDGSWPKAIAETFVGKISPEELLRQAQMAKEDSRVRERLAEAYFFLAQKHLLDGDLGPARDAFQQAAAQAIPRSQEFVMAEIAMDGWKAPIPPPAHPLPKDEKGKPVATPPVGNSSDEDKK